MKINDSSNKLRSFSVEKPNNANANTAKADAAKALQAEDKSNKNVTLSPAASKLQSLEEKVKASDTVDAEKVNAIKSSIAKGEFKVDPEKIANGLISSVKDFLSAQK